MDSSVGLCAARCTPGTVVSKDCLLPVSAYLRARKQQWPPKERSRLAQNAERQAGRAPVYTARGELETELSSQPAKVSASIVRLRRKPAASRGSGRLRRGERRALAQKIGAASAALGSMVGGSVCAWQVRPEAGAEVTALCGLQDHWAEEAGCPRRGVEGGTWLTWRGLALPVGVGSPVGSLGGQRRLTGPVLPGPEGGTGL